MPSAIIALLAICGILLACYGGEIIKLFGQAKKAWPGIMDSHGEGIQKYAAITIMVLVLNFIIYLGIFFFGTKMFSGEWPTFGFNVRIIGFQAAITVATWAGYKLGFFSLPKSNTDAKSSKTTPAESEDSPSRPDV